MDERFAKTVMDKVRDDYDAIADDFSATRTWLWPELKRFGEFVRPGSRVLDVGCGNGRAYQLFEGLAIDYEGIDISEKLIAHAKRKVRNVLAQFRVGSMTELPYEDGGFDAVLAIAVVHHIPSAALRLQAMREAYRVLRPGGYLLMTNWNRWTRENVWTILRMTLKRVLGLSGYDFKDVLLPWKRGSSPVMRYYHAFTSGELRRLCERAGFAVEEQYYTTDGKPAKFWNGANLVTICRKTSAPNG